MNKKNLKVVILAGGLGSRLSEETQNKPKPMVEIGGKPILWHIMKIYSHYNLNNFIICCGYKSSIIKEYFSNYALNNSDVTFDLKNNSFKTEKKSFENWKVTLLDTGENSNTGGRLRYIEKYLKKNEDFLFTYGDGVGNVNIDKLLKFHKSKKNLCTVTAVKIPGRFGSLEFNEDNTITQFKEKPLGDGGWINGGFFILNQKILKNIKNNQSSLEKDVLPILVKNKKVSAYNHDGFWQAMDTMRDKSFLEEQWASKSPPWKIW